MSAHKRAAEEKRYNQHVKRNARKKRLTLSWDAVPVHLLGLFVQCAVQSGRAMLLGTTSDGSVLSVSIYDDGERERYYLRNNADVVEQLVEIIAEYNETAADALWEAARPDDGETEPLAGDAPVAPL